MSLGMTPTRAASFSSIPWTLTCAVEAAVRSPGSIAATAPPIEAPANSTPSRPQGSVWALMSTPALTQTKSSAPPLVITAYGGKTPATPYKSPKTPWGEPDLVGVWSSDDDAGLPMSRPPAFGDRLYQTDEEYAAR